MNIYISNNRIISRFYSGYQPFPRAWKMDKEKSKAVLSFGVNRVELTFEIWNKIFKDIMISEGVCSERTSIMLEVKSFSIQETEIEQTGVNVEYSYYVKEIV